MMKTKILTPLFVAVILFVSKSVNAQNWNNTGSTYTAYNLGLGTSVAPNNLRLDVVKAGNSAYTAVFRSATSNDSYLYHAFGPTYNIIGSSRNGSGLLRKIGFAVGTTDSESDVKMTIDVNGNVGIGSMSPDAKLTVNGTVHAKEVFVDINIPAPDYVFEPSYELMPLSLLSKYLEKNKHLPDVPAGKELEENGMNVSEMNMLLLRKVEELTLYILELKEHSDKLEAQNNALQQRVEALENK